MKLNTVVYKGYTITTDKDQMFPVDIHRWLSEEAYWSLGITYDAVKLLFDNSYCVGVIKDGKQIGFARIITDYSTFGYLADVYVEEPHRGKGLCTQMLDILFEQEWVQGLRRIMLSTIDARDLYRKYKFTECRYPDRLMEKLRSPDWKKRE